jgi:hypothetical protein
MRLLSLDALRPSLETSVNSFDFKSPGTVVFAGKWARPSNTVSSLLLQTIAVSKAGRRHAGHPAKRAREVVLMLKPQVETHVQNTKICILEKLLRTRNAPVENVSVGAESGAFPEQGREIIHAQIRVPSKVREGDVLAEVRVNILQNTFQTRGRQARILDRFLASGMRRIRITSRLNRVRPSGFRTS